MSPRGCGPGRSASSSEPITAGSTAGVFIGAASAGGTVDAVHDALVNTAAIAVGALPGTRDPGVQGVWVPAVLERLDDLAARVH